MKAIINVINLEPVKQALTVTTDLLGDERIPLVIRTEYITRMEEIKWQTEADSNA